MSLIVEVSCSSSRETKRFVLKDGQSVEIGRSNEELHLFNDPRLSRRHFIIRYSDGQIEIKHLSKTNPTLVASDGTKDFKKVDETRRETGSCRIIAGSHRFVLMAEKDEPVSDHTVSKDEQSDFWSDVDVECISEEHSSAIERPATRGGQTIQDSEPPPVVKTRPAKTDFFDDDLPEKRPDESAEQPMTKVKKLFFPVTDDFFDD